MNEWHKPEWAGEWVEWTNERIEWALTHVNNKRWNYDDEHNRKLKQQKYRPYDILTKARREWTQQQQQREIKSGTYIEQFWYWNTLT